MQPISSPQAEALADQIVETKLAELSAEGIDVANLSEAQMREAVMPRLSQDELSVVGQAGILRMVQVEIGRKIIKCLEQHVGKIHQPDIIPCLTAYFEDQAKAAAN